MPFLFRAKEVQALIHAEKFCSDSQKATNKLPVFNDSLVVGPQEED